MEVASYIVQETEPTILRRLCEKLAESGFEDFHSSSVKKTCETMKQLLDVDLLKKKSFERTLLKSSRPHLLINEKTGNVVMLGESKEHDCVDGKAFQITCFAKSQGEVADLLESTKNLLGKDLGFPSTIIHNGSLDEICNKMLIKSLSETPRTELVKKVKKDILSIFTNKNCKNALRRLTNIPIKAFDQRMLSDVDPDKLVAYGIMKDRFAPVCKKCGEVGYDVPFLFDSKQDVSSVLKSRSLVCPSCERKLDPENASVKSFYQFTDLGLECSKGLWLEAYVKTILEKNGIKKEKMKLCSFHGRDEIDITFSEGDSMFICECRDKVVGQNDVYVLAMKVNRIDEDEYVPVVVDKVLIVSTEPISKDIMTAAKEKEKPEYIFATGNPEKIQREIVKAVNKARRQYKNERLRELSDILLWFLPSTVEEAYMRRFAEEEFLE